MTKSVAERDASNLTKLGEYRDEGFAACDGEEPPCWISVEKPDGSQRTEEEALQLTMRWLGEAPEEEWPVSRVPMYVGLNEYGDLRVETRPDDLDHAIGPVEFWRIGEP